MKIGVCLRTWGEKGGIGVYTRSVIPEMVRLGAEHQWVLFFSAPAHIGTFASLPNVEEVHVPATNVLLWDQVSIPYHVARTSPDVVFHTKFAIPLAVRRPTAMVLHGTERFVYPEFSKKLDILFFRTIYRLYLKRAHAVLAVSENAKRDVVRFRAAPEERVHTVYLATPPGFEPVTDPGRLNQVRRRYELPERFILGVGLIYPGKNLSNLLLAYRKLVDRQTNPPKLVVAGKGRRMYGEDFALAETLDLQDHVIFVGYIPHTDLPAVYSLAEFLAFPSYYESFGLVTLEAQACGCPVLVSTGGGAPEAAGEAAVYVDPHDVDDIVAGMIRLLEEPGLREDLVVKGFQNTGRFSWTTAAKKTLEILESLNDGDS